VFEGLRTLDRAEALLFVVLKKFMLESLRRMEIS